MAEARPGRLVGQQPRREDFDRNLALQALVEYPVDDPHPAFPDLVGETVMGEGLASPPGARPAAWDAPSRT